MLISRLYPPERPSDPFNFLPRQPVNPNGKRSAHTLTSAFLGLAIVARNRNSRPYPDTFVCSWASHRPHELCGTAAIVPVHVILGVCATDNRGILIILPVPAALSAILAHVAQECDGPRGATPTAVCCRKQVAHHIPEHGAHIPSSQRRNVCHLVACLLVVCGVCSRCRYCKMEFMLSSILPLSRQPKLEKEPCDASSFRFYVCLCLEPTILAEGLHHRPHLVVTLGKVSPVEGRVVGCAQNTAVSKCGPADDAHHPCDAAVDLVCLGAQTELGMALLVLAVDSSVSHVVVVVCDSSGCVLSKAPLNAFNFTVFEAKMEKEPCASLTSVFIVVFILAPPPLVISPAAAAVNTHATLLDATLAVTLLVSTIVDR